MSRKFYISKKTLLLVGPLCHLVCQFVGPLPMYNIHKINIKPCFTLTSILLCRYLYWYFATQQYNVHIHLPDNSQQRSSLLTKPPRHHNFHFEELLGFTKTIHRQKLPPQHKKINWKSKIRRWVNLWHLLIKVKVCDAPLAFGI